LRKFVEEYLGWLGIPSFPFDARDKTLRTTVIYDHFDPIDKESLESIISDPIQRAVVYRLNLVFDSYFNMPFLPLLAYKYFDAN
jgi:hypothetical protein